MRSVVFRPVLLDKIVLEHKRLELRIGYDIFKIAHMADHPAYLLRVVSRRLEILPDPVFQAYRLTNIDDIVMVIMHYINSRFPRELLQFLFNYKHTSSPTSQLVIHNKLILRHHSLLPQQAHSTALQLIASTSSFYGITAYCLNKLILRHHSLLSTTSSFYGITAYCLNKPLIRHHSLLSTTSPFTSSAES